MALFQSARYFCDIISLLRTTACERALGLGNQHQLPGLCIEKSKKKYRDDEGVPYRLDVNQAPALLADVLPAILLGGHGPTGHRTRNRYAPSLEYI